MAPASKQIFDQLHQATCDENQRLLAEVNRFFRELYPNGYDYHTEEFEERDEFDILPQPAQTIRDIAHFAPVTSELSLQQWLAAPSGSRFRQTLQALERIQAPQTHALLQAAWQAFQPQLPATSTSLRNYQLTQLTADQTTRLQQLTSQLQEQPEDLYDLAVQYCQNAG